MSIFFFSSIIFPFGKRESGNDQLAHHLEDALCSTTKKIQTMKHEDNA